MEFLRQSQEFENMKKNQALELEKAKMEERKKVEEEAKKRGYTPGTLEWGDYTRAWVRSARSEMLTGAL